MNFIIAAILGLVQGLTEFIPVSSGGHLVILERLTGYQIPALTFHVFLHAGTMIAVCLCLQKDMADLLRELAVISGDVTDAFRSAAHSGSGAQFRSRIVRTNQKKLAVMVLMVTVPSLIIGFLLSSPVRYAYESPMLTAVGFFLTGILLLVTDMVKPGEELPGDLHAGTGALIGAAQGIASFPGISRNAVVLCSGICVGFGRRAALRFSYIVSVPVSLAALIYGVADGVKNGVFSGEVIGCCLTGMAVSAVVGSFTLKRCLVYMRKGKLSPFACYSFVAGLVAVLVSYV